MNSNDKLISAISSRQDFQGFIKQTDSPVQSLTPQQKVILNRKGNELFNNGKVEEAGRIFITTGYSDGLTRVGDTYMSKNQIFKALKFYTLAKNRRKTEPIIEKMGKTLSLLIKE